MGESSKGLAVGAGSYVEKGASEFSVPQMPVDLAGTDV